MLQSLGLVADGTFELDDASTNALAAAGLASTVSGSLALKHDGMANDFLLALGVRGHSTVLLAAGTFDSVILSVTRSISDISEGRNPDFSGMMVLLILYQSRKSENGISREYPVIRKTYRSLRASL